jgi:hypothetical protein
MQAPELTQTQVRAVQTWSSTTASDKIDAKRLRSALDELNTVLQGCATRLEAFETSACAHKLCKANDYYAEFERMDYEITKAVSNLALAFSLTSAGDMGDKHAELRSDVQTVKDMMEKQLRDQEHAKQQRVAELLAEKRRVDEENRDLQRRIDALKDQLSETRLVSEVEKARLLAEQALLERQLREHREVGGGDAGRG